MRIDHDPGRRELAVFAAVLPVTFALLGLLVSHRLGLAGRNGVWLAGAVLTVAYLCASPIAPADLRWDIGGGPPNWLVGFPCHLAGRVPVGGNPGGAAAAGAGTRSATASFRPVDPVVLGAAPSCRRRAPVLPTILGASRARLRLRTCRLRTLDHLHWRVLAVPSAQQEMVARPNRRHPPACCGPDLLSRVERRWVFHLHVVLSRR